MPHVRRTPYAIRNEHAASPAESAPGYSPQCAFTMTYCVCVCVRVFKCNAVSSAANKSRIFQFCVLHLGPA